MSAERAPQPGGDAEILYVVVPPYAVRPALRPSFWQRGHYALWLGTQSSQWEELARVVQSFVGAIGFAVCCCIGLYGLYYLKSILGIDIFPDKHLEDFVPIPGYRRW